MRSRYHAEGARVIRVMTSKYLGRDYGRACHARYMRGRVRYGDRWLDPERDLRYEAREEIMDAANYLCLDYVRGLLPRWRLEAGLEALAQVITVLDGRPMPCWVEEELDADR